MSGQAQATPTTKELFEHWATDPTSAVALHLKQKLLPVGAIDSQGGIVFPPTYADIGYNIDVLADGTKVATIDSVGSQANRIEPLFKEGGALAGLAPQIKIEINKDTTVSIFDLPHRAADATVQSSPGLAELASNAFVELRKGNAAPLCALAPTSLVFGVWDSRGGTGEKRPRLVRSLIRAWDVEVFHSAAQFNSVWKKLNDEQRRELNEEAKKKKVKLSDKGLNDAPATFRRIEGNKIPQFRDGAPNLDARVLGGVRVKAQGWIEREVTVNLLALRGLTAGDDAETKRLRRYLLGLTLLVATQEMDLFLREGCLLRYASDGGDVWYEVPRRGDPRRVEIVQAQDIRSHIEDDLKHFKSKWPTKLDYEFDIPGAKRLLAKKTEEEKTAEEPSS